MYGRVQNIKGQIRYKRKKVKNRYAEIYIIKRSHPTYMKRDGYFPLVD